MIQIKLGDCLEILKTIHSGTVDAIVTDPPYGLSFMGKHWDYNVPSVEIWKEALRVLKPGGHLLSFGGTRTYHRMVVNIEDAGFEIRDQLQWIYGSGFPKSLDVSKAMDKANGTLKEIGTGKSCPDIRANNFSNSQDKERLEIKKSIPNSNLAKQWQGWSTALKPANEPIVLARKPLIGTVAENVENYGTGALNIDASRVGYQSEADKNSATPQGVVTSKKPKDGYAKAAGVITERHEIDRPELKGRWPSNVIFDEEAAALLDEQSGVLKSGELKGYKSKESENNCMTGKNYEREFTKSTASIGGASRFFYCAKASKSERNAGLEDMPEVKLGVGDERPSGQSMQRLDGREARQAANHHPTVKPIKLMQYLVKLITPPNGTVLDPFMGSGTTGVASKSLGFNFIGIEREAEYIEIAKRRIENEASEDSL